LDVLVFCEKIRFSGVFPAAPWSSSSRTTEPVFGPSPISPSYPCAVMFALNVLVSWTQTAAGRQHCQM
jgi:hypothetical protein